MSMDAPQGSEPGFSLKKMGAKCPVLDGMRKDIAESLAYHQRNGMVLGAHIEAERLRKFDEWARTLDDAGGRNG